jgi:hypothetical protein
MMDIFVIITNALRSYHEAMAGTIGTMRPHLDLRVVAPDDLAATIAHTRPRAGGARAVRNGSA